MCICTIFQSVFVSWCNRCRSTILPPNFRGVPGVEFSWRPLPLTWPVQFFQPQVRFAPNRGKILNGITTTYQRGMVRFPIGSPQPLFTFLENLIFRTWHWAFNCRVLFKKMHISLVNIWQDDQICSDPDLFWAKTWNEQSGCSLM